MYSTVVLMCFYPGSLQLPCTIRIATVFIENRPELPVDKGDILTVAGGTVVILLVAVIANPGLLSSVLPGPAGGHAVQEPVPSVTQTPVSVVSAMPTPAVNRTPAPPPPLFRITYTNTPFSYPVIHLPDHMEVYGASSTPLLANTTVTFAYMEESSGGLTQVFSVPYQAWALNISVTANTQPQYSLFRMVLCDAQTGDIITGSEIQNGGTMYKAVRSSGKMYMIVSVDYVDSFRINLETPVQYYVQAGPAA